MAEDWGGLLAVLLQSDSGESGEPGGSQQVILLLLVILAIMFLVVQLSRRRLAGRRTQEKIKEALQSQGKGDATRRPSTAGMPRSEIQKLYVELHEFAREIEGRLDTKIAYLRQLIADAEKVGKTLDRLMDEAPGAVGAVERVREAAPEASGEPESAREGPGSPSSDGESSGGPSPDEIPQPEMGNRVDVTVGEPSSSGPGVRGPILDLLEEGKNPAEIAEKVGIPKGEVELIINLHQSQKSGSRGEND